MAGMPKLSLQATARISRAEAQRREDEAERWNDLEEMLLAAGKASRLESVRWNNLASTAADARLANQELARAHSHRAVLPGPTVKAATRKGTKASQRKAADVVEKVREEFQEREEDLQQAVVASTLATTTASTAIDALVHKRPANGNEEGDGDDERPPKKARTDEA